MFKIGEFSKLMQVSIRMLRYYDEQGLLKPAKIDPFTGYRMYSTEQIPRLQEILLLRDSKFSTTEMKAIMKARQEIDLRSELEKKKIQIEKEIQLEQDRIEKINHAVKELKDRKFQMYCNINYKKVETFWIISKRERIPTYFHEGLLWKELCAFVEREHIVISQNIYNNVAIYHDREHKDHDVDVEVGMLVTTPGKEKDGFTYRQVEPIDKMAYAMVYGPYSNLGNAYEQIAYWLESHQEQMAEKPSRQICHIGEGDGVSPEEYLTEIQIPLK
ncbi:transcriptional regulator, MerR family [Lachnospiraceae bacterium KM106-2]|nr:transcriptional regulator, MerR family [Lachnospiraceae bacterium KM106-2]